MDNNIRGVSSSICGVSLRSYSSSMVGRRDTKVQGKEEKMMLEFLGLIGIAIGLTIACVSGIVFGVWVVNTLTNGKLKEIWDK